MTKINRAQLRQMINEAMGDMAQEPTGPRGDESASAAAELEKNAKAAKKKGDKAIRKEVVAALVGFPTLLMLYMTDPYHRKGMNRIMDQQGEAGLKKFRQFGREVIKDEADSFFGEVAARVRRKLGLKGQQED